jgi:TonB family protein
MKHLPVLLLILVNTVAFGQPGEEKFVPVQVKPDYEGGMNAFFEYIYDNLEYPPTAVEEEVEGKVFVEFVIDTTGAILDKTIKVAKSIHPLLDSEAVRLLQESPDWIPGRITPNGKPAKVRMVLPVQFEIDKKTRRKMKKAAKQNSQ